MGSGEIDFEQRVELGYLRNRGPVPIWSMRVGEALQKTRGSPEVILQASRLRALNGSTQVGREGSWAPSQQKVPGPEGFWLEELSKGQGGKMGFCSPRFSSGSLAPGKWLLLPTWRKL
uniref:Uncharacterized protein n=1 Tax=Micrurus paraensis TaxID=1970185 RepID=A0A2D4KM59_9SAUR